MGFFGGVGEMDFFTNDVQFGSYLENMGRNVSHSGVDIKVVVHTKDKKGTGGGTTVVLSDLQTISISTHRDKFPVHGLGQVTPKSFVRGKRCLPATERVAVKDKGYVSVADVEPGDEVQSSATTYNKVVGSYVQGEKLCHELKLGSGHGIIASYDHPISTPQGWVNTADLKEGDLVHVVGQAPCPTSPMVISDDILKMIAYLIGDGCTHAYRKKSGSVSHSISLSIVDNEMDTIGEEVDGIVDRLGTFSRDDRRREDKCIGRHIGVCIGRGDTAWQLREYNELHNALCEFDLYNRHSHEKFIPPDFIAKLDKRQIALFLNRLFATDGCYSISKDRKYIGAYYTSTSETLIDDIRLMLKKLGIDAIKALWKKPGDIGGRPDIISRHYAYSLVISRAYDLVRFYNLVGIYGKDTRIQHLIPLLKSRIKDAQLGISMREFGDLVTEAARRQSRSARAMKVKYNLYNHRGSVTPRRAIMVSAAVGDPIFNQQVDDLVDELLSDPPELLEFPVVSNQTVGELPVYDLEVADRHTFVSELIPVHNTCAGSMIFTLFNREALTYILDPNSENQVDMGKDRQRYFDNKGNAQLSKDILIDQLPPFDITIVCANEYGHVSRAALYGVEVYSSGTVMSIHDLLTEGTCGYVARDYQPLTSLYSFFNEMTDGGKNDAKLKGYMRTLYYYYRQYSQGLLTFDSYLEFTSTLNQQIHTEISSKMAGVPAETFDTIVARARGFKHDQTIDEMLAQSHNPFV